MSLRTYPNGPWKVNIDLLAGIQFFTLVAVLSAARFLAYILSGKTTKTLPQRGDTHVYVQQVRGLGRSPTSLLVPSWLQHPIYGPESITVHVGNRSVA